MKKSVICLIFALAACGGSSNEDCTEGQKLNPKSADIGETCILINYGTCQNIDNCTAGDCVANDIDTKTCRAPCSQSSDCDTNMVCDNGHCLPPASCSTFCDGVTCCTYTVDPTNSQRCVRGSCTKVN